MTHHDRNEEFQEDLWKRSFKFLKNHLSPEMVEKYGPPLEPPAKESPVDVQETKGETTTVEEKESVKENVTAQNDHEQ